MVDGTGAVDSAGASRASQQSNRAKAEKTQGGNTNQTQKQGPPPKTEEANRADRAGETAKAEKAVKADRAENDKKAQEAKESGGAASTANPNEGQKGRTVSARV